MTLFDVRSQTFRCCAKLYIGDLKKIMPMHCSIGKMPAKFFDVEFRDVQLKPINNTWHLSEDDSLSIQFNLDGYKEIALEPTQYPFQWQGYIQRTLYSTHWENFLPEKTLKIFAVRKNPFWKSDEIVAATEIDLHTLVSGPTRYELDLLHPIHRHPICCIHFTVSMVQIVKNVAIKLHNVDVSALRFSNSPDCTIQAFCGYIDPLHTQWEAQPVALSQSTVPNFKVKLAMHIIASNFIKASVHLVFLCSSHPVVSEREIGRLVIPVLGNYDSERQRISLKERILWNTHNLAACGLNATESASYVSATLLFQNGPRFMQLHPGARFSSQQGINGCNFIGFPLPKLRDVDIDVTAFDIAPFVRKHALYLEPLTLLRYDAQFPDWFLNRRPNSHLLHLQTTPERAKLLQIVSAWEEKLAAYNADCENLLQLHNQKQLTSDQYLVQTMPLHLALRTQRTLFRSEIDRLVFKLPE